MGSEYGPAGPVLRLRVIDGVDPREEVILETATGRPERMTLAEAARRATSPVLVALPARLFRSHGGVGGKVTALLGRTAMAMALRVWPAALAVIETRDAAGRHLLVAAPQTVLAETTRFIEAHGLRVAGLIPDAAPPSAFPAAGVTGSAAALTRFLPRRQVGGLAGLGAVAALLAGAAFLLAPGGAPESPRADAVLPDMPAITAADVAAADAGSPVALPEPPGLLVEPPEVLQPAPRALPRIAILAADPPRPRPAGPPLLSAAAGEAVTHPPRAVATRSIPPELREEMRAATAEEGSADGNEGRARQIAALMPLPRPGGGESASDAAGPAHALTLRPLPRQAPDPDRGTGGATMTAEQPAGSGARPMPRPQDPGRAIEAAISAALSGDPGAENAGASPAATLAARRPEPRRVVPPPQVARAAPATLAQPQRQAAPATPAPAAERARPPVPAAQPTQIARAEPARQVQPPRPPAQPVQQQTRPAAAVQPQQQARPATPVQPQQQARFQAAPPAATAPAPQPSAGANPAAGLTLIGVFGTSSQRHALIRLPGGNVQRVRAGESVGGVQIAAVGQDSVRFRAGGREGVLRLPD